MFMGCVTYHVLPKEFIDDLCQLDNHCVNGTCVASDTQHDHMVSCLLILGFISSRSTHLHWKDKIITDFHECSHRVVHVGA